tara:strand:- start:44 stop:520 length:477 start_codon:yes stop_codon:yes gene_type:complete
VIIYQDNFLTKDELDYLIGLWDDSKSVFTEPIISFYSIDLKNNNIDLDLTPIHNNAFKRKLIHKMRLQKYNETFTQIKDFHEHENFNNYIMFLNDDFKGGELEFENGLIITPKAGSLVYFNNNERHRVHDCIGDRYIFTALGDIELDIQFKKRKKNII